MGLDISAHARLTPVECDGHRCDHIGIYVNDDFPGRAEPLESGCYATNDADPVKFRAGSYSGYNAWRERLSRLALGVEPGAVWQRWSKFEGKPFAELINFSDCEGTIGPIVSKRLAADFAAFDETAREKMDVYEYALYRDWLRAFERAADDGAVEFH